MAFPSASVPYVLNRAEVGGSFPAAFYGPIHTQPTVGISADAFLKVPVIGDVKLANGYFVYEYPGYVAFGGSTTRASRNHHDRRRALRRVQRRQRTVQHQRECALVHRQRHLSRRLRDRVQPRRGRMLDLGITTIGGGVIYSPFQIKLWPLYGCRWSPFAEKNVKGLRLTAARGLPVPISSRSRRATPAG